MPNSLLSALDFSGSSLGDIGAPVAAGVGAMLTIVAFVAALRKVRRPPPKPEPPPQPKEPEYDPFVQGSASEKRVAWRRRGNAVQVLIRGPGCTRDPLLGWVIDRSPGGLGLSVGREFPLGTRLFVQPTTGMAVHWIEVEVRFAGRENKRWHLGCKFLEPVQLNVLLTFG